MFTIDEQESLLEEIANTSDFNSTETDAKTRSTIEDVVKQLRALIRKDYNPGDKLPSIAVFARGDTIGGSQKTIADAMRILKGKGLVIPIPPVGTFVTNGDNAVYRTYMEIADALKKKDRFRGISICSPRI